MLKLNDSLLTALLAGGTATLLQMAIGWGLAWLKITASNTGLFQAQLFTNSPVPAPWAVLLGILANLAAGVFLALILIYILKSTGTGHALWKGAFVGLINPMLQYYFLTCFSLTAAAAPPAFLTQWHLYLVYLIWGLATAYLAVNYSTLFAARPR